MHCNTPDTENLENVVPSVARLFCSWGPPAFEPSMDPNVTPLSADRRVGGVAAARRAVPLELIVARSSELSVPRPVSPDRRVGGKPCKVAKEPRPESALRRVGGPRCDEPDDDDCDARFVGERLICDPQPVSWWPPAPWPPRLPLKWRRTGESTDTAAAVDLCGNQKFTARSC